MSRVIDAFTQFFDGAGDPLALGWLKFLVSGTNNSLKNTYADHNQSIPNANPVQLDAEGRCPNVFGDGNYKVILYYNNPVTGLPGAQLQEFDPVTAIESCHEGTAGAQFGEWVNDVAYGVHDIVTYNFKYYRSIAGSNVGNQPDTSPDKWEEILFLRAWNTNVTYLEDDVTLYNKTIYFSKLDANQGNQPDISPLFWAPVGDGTVLINWQESGTTLRPVVSGYDLGDSGHTVGNAFITAFGSFPVTPSSAPTTDFQVANKKYVDDTAAARMRWLGLWVPDTYQENDVVTDDGWLMIANTTTEDRPAPQPVGDRNWTRDLIGEIPFSEGSVLESVMYIGQRYSFTTAFFVSNVRIWIPSNATGINVEVWAVRDPTGANKRFVNVFPGFNVLAEETDSWLDLPVGNLYVEKGEIVDIFMIFRPGTGGSQFTYEWIYSSNNGDPGPGQIYHQKGQDLDKIRIHEQDTLLIDRSTSLDNLGPGSVFTMESSRYTWEILSISKIGDVYYLEIDPAVKASNDTSDFTFTYFGAISVYYAYNTDFFISESRVQGYFGNEYDPLNASYLNQNGYGLDIKVQNATSSDDWDVMSEPSLGGGGGGDATTLSGYYATDFAKIAENETITGQWDYTTKPTIDGELIYSAANGAMVEDAIINGRFDVWQRGTSFTSEGWTADHFYAGFSGATITCSQQTFTPGQTDVPGEPKYFYRINCTVADDLWFLVQPIEDVRRYAGQEVTLSVWMKANTSLSCQLRLVQNFGGGGSTSVMLTKNITLTTSWAEYFFTTTLGSISGKTIGTDSYLGVYFVQPNNTTGYFDIADISLNPGPDILPIRKKSYGDVFFDCIRYYESRQGSIAGYMTKSNDNYRSWDFTFSAEKYKNPTITPTGSGFTPTVSEANKKSFRLYYNSGDTTTERVLTEWVAEAEIPI